MSQTAEEHSFAPVWKPGFISKIVAEDRCHLNGLAMRDGKAAFVSAVCRSDTIDGWRADRRPRHGGGTAGRTGRQRRSRPAVNFSSSAGGMRTMWRSCG